MAYGNSEQPRPEDAAVPTSSREVGTRLELVMAQVGSRKNAAEIAGKSEDMLTRYAQGKTDAPFSVVARLAQAAGFSLDWIATGRGAPDAQPLAEGQLGVKVSEREQNSGIVTYKSASDLGDEYVLVPRYDVRASAGHGAVIHSEQVVDHLAFKAEWVRRQLRVNPSYLLLIEAMGDSMEETISDGDLLLVNTQEPRIKDNAIYALSVNGDLIVKRVQRRLDGTLLVKSDNPRYEPEELPPHLAGQLRVIGQVVWHGGLIR
ncbi:S24 family peptidase [Telmatospirillum sp. J64-1]|uniref:LexA family transcriptional regulator n=1 Tax=Telmatospirillum sp. J64-1 TaxID=2502183 RepID=UPI00115CEB12|nr:S24 family peptidase [Telmatospirillum sp. J64-1]